MGMKACPYCSEQIQEEAKKCKHCNEILDPALRAQGQTGDAAAVQRGIELEKAKEKASRALQYGIVGFFCFGIILGPAAIVLGNSASNTFQKYGQPVPSSATAGRTLGVIVTILWTLGIIARVAMIVSGEGR